MSRLQALTYAMDLCHQKQPPQKVYQPAQIFPSNFQLRQLDQKHVSKPGQTSYLLVRRPGKPSPPTPSSFLVRSDYEGNGLKSITRGESALLRGHLEREYLETEKVIVLRNTIMNYRFASFSPLFSGFGNLGS